MNRSLYRWTDSGSWNRGIAMGLSRGVHILSACLVLMFGGVLSKSIMSLDFNSPCPDQWYYLGGDNCAYVITSDLPSRNLQLFCQQLDAHLQLIEDKPVCLKSSRQNHLFYGDDETANTDADKVFKRGSHLNSGYDSTDEERGSEKKNQLSPVEEELILNKLREIVRKCTVADPMKRLTAPEVVKILGNLNVR